MKSPITFDLIILGGGISGLALAAAINHSDCRIAVIDRQTTPTPPGEDFDIRVNAINLASQAIFQAVGAWHPMAELRVSPYEQISVWDAASPAQIAFSSTEIGRPYLGHIIEHSVMKTALLQVLAQKDHVQVLHQVTPVGLNEQTDHICLALDNGTLLATRLLVGADGHNSWVAANSGLTSSSKLYDQSAVVATIRTELPHQRTAWQRFLPTGPLAFLPLRDPHYCSIVWSTTPEYAKQYQLLDEAKFNLALGEAIAYKLGAVQVVSPRAVFALRQQHARHYTKPRIALIGDAAHTIHPLAGQGANLGLLDSACLAEIIDAAFTTSVDIGTLANLRRYERWRKGENQLMLQAMTGFKTLFASQSSLMRKARHWGFALTQQLPGAKAFFMERATGLRGDLTQKAVFGFEELC